jgi:cell division protein FtsB
MSIAASGRALQQAENVCVHAQVKHAKLARELEASTASERVLAERVEELEQELGEVAGTARSRLRWLEAVADAARRRVEGLYREALGSVPAAVGGWGGG